MYLLTISKTCWSLVWQGSFPRCRCLSPATCPSGAVAVPSQPPLVAPDPVAVGVHTGNIERPVPCQQIQESSHQDTYYDFMP